MHSWLHVYSIQIFLSWVDLISCAHRLWHTQQVLVLYILIRKWPVRVWIDLPICEDSFDFIELMVVIISMLHHSIMLLSLAHDWVVVRCDIIHVWVLPTFDWILSWVVFIALLVSNLDFFVCFRCVGIVDIKDIVLALAPVWAFLTTWRIDTSLEIGHAAFIFR